MKTFPKIQVLKNAILKEHSEEDLKNVLIQYKEKWKIRQPSIAERVDILLDILSNTDTLTHTHEHLKPLLIIACRKLQVKIPYIYIHYPDKRDPEEVKREKEARNKARPPKIDYDEEIFKIQEKYQMKIQQWCKDKSRFEACCEIYKRNEFNEIIDLYLARIREPHKPLPEDGGRPPYVVWSLAELRREMTYIPSLPDEIICDYDSMISGFSKRYLSGESLNFREVSMEILKFFHTKMDGYERIVGWGK